MRLDLHATRVILMDHNAVSVMDAILRLQVATHFPYTDFLCLDGMLLFATQVVKLGLLCRLPF